MKALVIALCLAVAVPAAVAGAIPADSPARPANAVPFKDDARLETKVSLAEKDRPLGELLSDLGARLQVPLTAAPDTADDKVSLFLDQRPAAEVLQIIARQLDFQWTRRRSGYELSQSTASQRREATLREKEIEPQLQAIEARMRLLAQMLPMPRDGLEARQKEIGQRLAGQDLPAPERARLTEEQQAIADLQRPFAAVALTLFVSLTPAQLEQLGAGRDVHFSTLDHSLPPALAEQIHEVVAERMKRMPWKLDPEHRQADAIIRLSDFTGPRYLPKTAFQRTVRLEIGFTSGDQRQYAPALWMPTFPPAPPAPTTETKTDDPALKQEVSFLAARPQARPGSPPPSGGWRAGLLTVGDIGEALHQAAGLEVVADSFIRARLDSQGLAQKQPLTAILDRLGNEIDYDWQKEGNLLLLRDRIYYRDRPAEVPDRILLPWRKQVMAEGGPTLDSLAALAAALNESRARGMHDFWGWYLEGTPLATGQWADNFYRSRYHLRFWASLTPQQRQAAMAHAVIPVAQMSLPQRQAFLQVLTARDESVWGPLKVPQTLTATELAAGAFRLDLRDFQQQTFRLTFPSGNSMEFTQTLGSGEHPFTSGRGENGPHPEPVGPPIWMNGHTFTYYLADPETPALKMSIDLPRVTRG
jgi:hypothetical protein